MIELIIKDGLGNQLFEYAYARYLQEIYDEEMTINLHFQKNKDFRTFALNNFKLNDKVRILSNDEEENHMRLFKIRVLIANGIDVISWKLFSKKPLGEAKFIKRAKRGLYYTYNPYTEYKTIKSTKTIKYVFGNFQSLKNFESIESILKNELVLKTPVQGKVAEMCNRINDCNSVCVHVRRGDYLDTKWVNLQVCDYEYYLKAIELIKKDVQDPIFFVFSNSSEDIEWIKENYKFDANIIYVDLDNPDYEDFRLMNQCKYFILSNSTFCWWASYLAHNENKIVVAPSIWNKKVTQNKVIYLPSWRIIDV